MAGRRPSGTLERRTTGAGVDGLRRAQDTRIQVGVVKGMGEHANGTGGQTVAEIYAWNEYGTRHIPPRPTLYPTLAGNGGKYAQIMARLIAGELRGGRSNHGLLGVVAAGDVQEAILTLASPPNAPETIAKKGSSNPLIDTGQLRQSITWAEVDR